MIARLGHWLSDKAKRWVPDPFVLAILLTAIVFVLALPMLAWSPRAVIETWIEGAGGGKGFWRLLAFAMQMCLILLTGYALAESRACKSAVQRLARWPQSTASAAVMVASVAMGCALLNWGLGLIIGALLAREVGRVARLERRPLHYPLICAAGYTGLAVWHGGLSGSAPLKVTNTKQLTEILGPELAQQLEPMLLGETIGSTLNLIVLGACFLVIPTVLALMSPKRPDQMIAAQADDPEENVDEFDAPTTPAERLNQSFIIVAIPAIMGLSWFALWLATHGLGKLNPNVINLVMLSIGLLLHGSVKSYVHAIQRAVRSCAGIILQYPFYAGIMGIMAGAGLVGMLGAHLSGLGPAPLAMSTFYSAGLVNLFVPSGGGQWAVQGPIVMEAALQAGAHPQTILMALCYGDQWTNLIQPFWALPLLGICRISVSAIIGYTAILLLVSQLCFVVPLLFFV
ncbi:MAG: TIGR00366 family protein [Myxococcota bacterium]|nr:TIGR00366 family protein [Myxococcota bacterium]